MTDDRKNGPATDRDQAGRFKPGNPGRPKGSRHRATLALLKLFEGEAGDIGRVCIEAAKGGDVAAIRLVLNIAFGTDAKSAAIFNELRAHGNPKKNVTPNQDRPS